MLEFPLQLVWFVVPSLKACLQSRLPGKRAATGRSCSRWQSCYRAAVAITSVSPAAIVRCVEAARLRLTEAEALAGQMRMVPRTDVVLNSSRRCMISGALCSAITVARRRDKKMKLHSSLLLPSLLKLLTNRSLVCESAPTWLPSLRCLSQAGGCTQVSCCGTRGKRTFGKADVNAW